MSEPDSTPRRRPPTIDLTAKEVGTAQAGPAPDSAAADAAGERASSANAGGARASHNSRAGAYATGILIGAIVAGGAAAGLWAAGFTPGRDNTAQIAAPAAKTAADDHVSTRLDKLEQALQTPRADDGVAGRLNAAEAQDKSLGDALTALNHRVDEIAAAAKSASAAADDAKSVADQVKSANASGVQRSDLDALGSRVAALESAVKSLTADNAQRSSSQSQSDSTARATLAAEALRSAVERGVPFQAELAAVKSFGADQDSVAALGPFAARGVPGAAALGRELATLTPSLQRADSETPTGSLLGRLEARAQRLVRITPIDAAAAPAGHDASSLIGRINADAARGDIEAALADLAKLPDATRAPAAAWIREAQARETALAAARRIAADALVALAKPASQ